MRAHPTSDEINQISAFQGYELSQIHVLATDTDFESAWIEIQNAGLIGFDTESKPTFAKGEVSTEPHVVQMALSNRAYTIPIGATPPLHFLQEVPASNKISKAGFGLKSDRSHLRRGFGIQVQGAVDLTQPLRSLGYRQMLGARAAVAVVLGEHLRKSKTLSTSNWAKDVLSVEKLIHAADDALATLRIHRTLSK